MSDVSDTLIDVSNEIQYVDGMIITENLIAIDATGGFTIDISLADIDSTRLERAKEKDSSIQTLQLDVTNKKELRSSLIDFDLVICAVPGFLGFETLKAISTHCLSILFGS